MAWQKQTNYKSGKKVDDAKTLSEEDYTQEFLKDWSANREWHSGQDQVMDALFNQKYKYIFYRCGRKGAKTTTAIDSAWRIANTIHKSVVYLCYPTIAQGIEVVWEERRLQTCDRRDDSMFDKWVEKTDDSRHMLWFKNGSFIKLIGTWTEARGRGTQPDFLICDEFQDCNPDYIEAMDSNLSAKDAPCILMGTPPKKRNHYEEWIERVSGHPKGKVFHFSSYINDKLPHLKDWLDNKKTELIRAGKEDVWLREYMAELCYSSSDRVLPDAKFVEKEEIENFASNFAYSDRIPFLAISASPSYVCAILGLLVRQKTVLVFDHVVVRQVWDRSYDELFPMLKEKTKYIQDLCGKKLRKIVWDESGAFPDVVSGFSKCRKDVKWQDRGLPLLREMMVKGKIKFSIEIADFGMECQNLLIDETEKEVQKNYPHVCTLAMLVNEYFSQDKIVMAKDPLFDKFDAFREMGIPCPPKKKQRSLFSPKF